MYMRASVGAPSKLTFHPCFIELQEGPTRLQAPSLAMQVSKSCFQGMSRAKSIRTSTILSAHDFLKVEQAIH